MDKKPEKNNLDKELKKLVGEKDFKELTHLSLAEKQSIINVAPHLQLANNMKQCFWLGNKKHETIYINKTYQKISGYSLKETLRKQSSFCFTKEAKNLIDRHHELRKKGKTSQYEGDILTKHGEVIPVIVSGSPTKDGGTMGIFSNLKILEKLGRSDQKLLSIVGAKDFKIIKQLKQKDQDLIIKYRHAVRLASTVNHCFWLGDEDHNTVYVNEAYQETTGYSLKECIGKPADFCFDEKSKKIIDHQHNLRSAGISSKYEASYITKKGKSVPVLISGAPTESKGSYGIHIDLREVKKLALSKEINTQIIKNSPEAIIFLDKNDKVQLWNSGAQKMFGYKEEEVINKKLVDFLVPKELFEEHESIRDEIERKNIIKNFETQRLRKTGKPIETSLSVTKVFSETKEHIGFIVIYQDISHKKKINSELQKRFEAIQDAYKELGLEKRQSDYLHEIAELAASKATTEQLCQLIVSAASMLTKCDASTLRLYNEKTKDLTLKAYLGVSSRWLSRKNIKLTNSLAGEAFESKRPVIIHDIESSNKHTSPNLVKAHGFKTVIVIPLIFENQPVGSLSLYSGDPGKFRMIETDFLEKFQKQCAIALYAKIH